MTTDRQNLYPWMNSVVESLSERQQKQQLPHAILLAGIEGIGKFIAASNFAKALLCDSALHEPVGGLTECGQCHSCQLIAAGSHPDLRIVEAEKVGGNISIDQIRAVNEFVTLKSQLGGMQVVIINDAENINRNGSNALLKTLEEPTPDVLIILLSSLANQLIPTIRSRCQMLKIVSPSAEQAKDWLLASGINQNITPEQISLALQLTQNAPLLSKAFLEQGVVETYQQQLSQFVALTKSQHGPMEIANLWHGESTVNSVEWLFLWVSKLIRIKLLQSEAASKDAQPLQNLASRLDLFGLYRFYDKLIKSRRLLRSQVNQQLLLEDILIDWQRLCRLSSR